MQAIRDLHGADAEVVKDPVTLKGDDGLADYVREQSDGFVYAVAGASHYLAAGLAGLRFGVMANHPAKRMDGSFGLASVYWANYPVAGKGQTVWLNPDPTSDTGEALIPVTQ